MTRRAGGIITSRIISALLIAALALAAGLAGLNDGGGERAVYAQTTTVDYDDDDDGLIDVRTHQQLNAIRWNLNGRGDSGNAVFVAAFPNRDTTSGGRMGCPSGSCVGYELRAHIDLDTDGDGASYTGTGTSAASDSGDAYHNSGSGWDPIGTEAAPWATTFRGNGYTVSNLFLRRTVAVGHTGLFGSLSPTARVDTLGVVDAFVYGNTYVGIIAGSNHGTIASSYTSGEVIGREFVGGITGHNEGFSTAVGAIIACYSTANATGTGTPGFRIGGFVGEQDNGGSVHAGYSTGTVTSSGSQYVAAFIGRNVVATNTHNAYWDTNASGRADDGDTAMPEGKTTAELKTPTGYAGIFSGWNVNVDGAGGGDDPWDFGGANEYPVLKFGGHSPDAQRDGNGNYDKDGDGLIEIANLAQLNAVRWDLNGNGARDSTSATNWASHSAAFPNAHLALGCPDTDDADTNPGPCLGYELAAHLDFDTDNDGATYTGTGTAAASDSGDAYHNSGSGWQPIGGSTPEGSRFTATFKGNGYLISNLFIKRTTERNGVGLFGGTSASSRIESLGVVDAYVYGQRYTGIVVGHSRGTVAASHSDGAAISNRSVGGLIGVNYGPDGGGVVTASYSGANVTQLTTGFLTGNAGGLVGHNENQSNVTASYSTGTVTAQSSTGIGGLTGGNFGTVTNSYWDTQTSGVSSGDGVGKTTAELQSPTGYAGIYENWNVNVSGDDDPWDFGTASEYPVLKYGGMDPQIQRGDYDTDDDGLIEISSLAQLDAVRWDLNGDGARNTVSVANWKNHQRAFLNAASSLGCPDTDDAGTDPGPCLGYELVADLDFDTDGDGSTYEGTGTGARGDDGDDWYNGGEGWLPIGGYAAEFKGNGHVISNLFIKRTTQNQVGLFGLIASDGRVESLGVADAYVYGSQFVGGVAGYNYGAIAGSWSGGYIRGGTYVGGLVGIIEGIGANVGHVSASYSRAAVSSASGGYIGGLTGFITGDSRVSATYSIGTVTSGSSTNVGGFAGDASTSGNAPAIITASYWDTQASGRSASGAGVGKTTAELQSPTHYTGIFRDWNVNVDGETGGDDPWHFGGASAYPTLKYGGMDPEDQRFGDYDLDGDGLIEITTLAQLDAVRHDLNGNGDSTHNDYAAAFPDRITASGTRMGCPAGSCVGYELLAHLDFDTDGDGATYTGTGTAAVGDPDDAYYNGGSGWAPIGLDNDNLRYTAAFKGNGYTVSNLFIKRAFTASMALFGSIDVGARVESLGVVNAFVHGTLSTGTLVGTNRGHVIASYSTGEVIGSEESGGLVGYNWGPGGEGDVTASYSHANVTMSGSGDFPAGLVGNHERNSIIADSYATGRITATSIYIGGLVGNNNGVVRNSYFDSQTAGTTRGAGSAQTTSALKTPTGYTGIYANWNVNDYGANDPWDFGAADSYPVLKYGGHDPYAQRGDYDLDNDGLIEITTLDQLNAVRWDLDGDAAQDSVSAEDWKKYRTAFRNIDAAGCPSSTCSGYELAANLDFDTDRDGATYTGTGADAAGDPNDAYYNGGKGWQPIGDSAAPFAAEFNGGGYAVSNLFVKRTDEDGAGLFGEISSSARVESAFLINPYVRARNDVGALVGVNRGAVTASFSSGGDIYAVTDGGGLVGHNRGSVIAAYSTATVDGDDGPIGGLIGRMESGATASASYSAGVVETGATTRGGFSGNVAGTIQNSFWDTDASGIADDADTNMPEGKTTAEMQGEAFYDGIFANWNVNVDGSGGGDDPWDFGAASDYPALKYDGMDPAILRGFDFDADDDGLIEITALAQLDAVRWDLGGNGAQGASSVTEWKMYGDAFFHAAPSLGCPDTADDDSDPGPCLGYELAAHLDFDTDGDGATYTGTGTAAVGDPGDAYYNGGAGWEPIGTAPGGYFAAFEGNGYVVSNLFVKRAAASYVGLFGLTAAAARVESVAIVDAYVNGNTYVGALMGYNRGAIAASYSDGWVYAAGNAVGGLVGYNDGDSTNVGSITASYSRAAVAASATSQYVGGFVGYTGSHSSIAAAYSTGTVTTTSTSDVGSFVGGGDFTGNDAATLTATYWNVTTNGVADDSDTNMPEGRLIAQLQSPADYVGVYAAWNVDIDGDGDADDPWDFGLAGADPTLKYGSHDPADQRFGDYDLDGDGLIEITTLAQLDAVRHDPNGNGDATHAAYAAAFPDRITTAGIRMGCTGTCSGYELAAHLDFDTDGDGATYTGTGVNAVGDPDDAYYNGGEGWAPLAPSTAYSATFKGNGYTISNMFVKRTGRNEQSLFGQTASSARVESLGVVDAYVRGLAYVGILAGTVSGTVTSSYTTGEVYGEGATGGFAGGVYLDANVTASYSSASVTKIPSSQRYVGSFTGIIFTRATVSDSYSSFRGHPFVEQISGSGRVTRSYGQDKTAAELQSPTGYTGIYENWNVDVDGVSGADDPWDFGTSSQYPVLKVSGLDPQIQRGDYDLDDDGLIEITTADQLNAIRHDPNGNARRDATSAADWKIWEAAFQGISVSGCQFSVCSGYELAADIDLDTDGDGATYTASGATASSDRNDAFHNGGAGWEPIGSDSARFGATFKGNGFSVRNLFIKRAAERDGGLFGALSGSARVESLTVPDAWVHAHEYAGAVAGRNYGAISASWSGGEIRAARRAGGLAGGNSGRIIAAYSRAAVSQANGSGDHLGGLFGSASSGARVEASYSTGRITSDSTNIGGLGGQLGGANVVASYWDSSSSGVADDSDTNPPEGGTTAQLQAPTDYAGIYAAWNVNVDARGGNDNPWNFGGAGEYPALQFGGMDPDAQRIGDYDRDGDRLIEITEITQLNAMRWDLNGNGARDSTSAANWASHNAAFPDAIPGFGCVGSCAGYELAAHIDFDTDGDGATYTGSGTSATGDSGDAFHSGGAGWLPIGSASAQWGGTFRGNGYTISNLFIKRTGGTDTDMGLFGDISRSARIESVGLVNAYVYGRTRAGALVGDNQGRVYASYSTGSVIGVDYLGGLVGNQNGAGADVGDTTDSWSSASVEGVGGAQSGRIGGLIGQSGSNTAVRRSYSTGAVTSTGTQFIGGFVGRASSTAATQNNLWDTQTSGQSSSAGATGRTTAQLQTPFNYTGIYANWWSGDPWDFGGADEYPVLKTAGHDPIIQRGDYDRDGDGLIEIHNLAQLNAVRWDLDGDGAQGATSAADWKKRRAAFVNANANMGCPATGCSGYELAAALDFDTDGDGATYAGTGTAAAGDSQDAYYNGGAGWEPIGDQDDPFAATFDGNGYALSNIFIKRPDDDNVGMFGGISSDARVESVALVDAYVYGNDSVGGLVGSLRGPASASYTTGAIIGNRYVGGLAGYLDGNYIPTLGIENAGAITASYSRAAVSSASGDSRFMGGLVGFAVGGRGKIAASYAAGTVTTTGTFRGGLGGQIATAGASGVTVTDSYWDASASGIPDDSDAAMPEGKTTSELQSVVSYTGIYANWNVDAGGDARLDDPWHLAGANRYPALKYGGMDPYLQHGGGDYDLDDDGLIEIFTLDRLNAVRWDLNGNATQDTASDADWTRYAAAFPGRDSRSWALMGCPSGRCSGYELADHLDFDIDGDGDVDGFDGYPHWGPIGNSTSPYAANFDGDNHKIANLTIRRTGNADDVGLFGRVSSTGVITGVGLPDASVSSSGAGSTLHVGALVGYLSGTVRSSWSTGTVSLTGTGNWGFAGGLAGYMSSGSTLAASWSGAHISSSVVSSGSGGITGRLNGGTITAAYSTGAVSAAANGVYAGGLAGVLHSGTITASYATGPSTATGNGSRAHPIGSSAGVPGFQASNLNITATYWDVGTADVADDADMTAPEGKTTSELQSVMAYSGVYQNWNVTIAGLSDPWDFGMMMMQYPMLKYDGMSLVEQGSLAMGMPSPNMNHPVVGQVAAVCLVDGPAMRAAGADGTGKTPWQWQRSTNGAAWTDITNPSGKTYYYTATSSDQNNYLRACVGLNETAPEGATRACVQMFAKTQASN